MGNGRPPFFVDNGQQSRSIAHNGVPARAEFAAFEESYVRFPRKSRAGRRKVTFSAKRKSGQRVAGGARDARTGPQSGDAGLAIAERLAKADPANAQWQRDLSISRSNIDNVRREQAG
jgi:hypothetical protein